MERNMLTEASFVFSRLGGAKVLLSFLYFFFLMTSYFIIRPVRDEMGIRIGAENMQWLFTGTFIGMLLIVPFFGWITKVFSKKIFVPLSYALFLAQLFLFYYLFAIQYHPYFLAALFFIWSSVFNLFVISIFWSVMSDLFTKENALTYFPMIAAGGSSGAIIGPSISAYFASSFGTTNLLLIAAGLLLLTLLILILLFRMSSFDGLDENNPLSSKGIWSGISSTFKSGHLSRIGLFIVIYTCMSTFLYFQQAHIVSNEISDPDLRTTYFALRDMGTNLLTLALQFFVSEKLMKKFGLSISLAIIPLITAAIFFLLSMSSSLYVLALAQILYRGGNFAIQKPSREVLFTDLSINEKYRSKNFLDTTIYRGGDAVSGWLFTGLSYIGLSLSGIALLAIPIAILWMIIGKSLGQHNVPKQLALKTL